MPKQAIDRLEVLFEAMEEHGNDQGTETQLGDAEEFLRHAFNMLPPELQDRFLASSEVKTFIERETSHELCCLCEGTGMRGSSVSAMVCPNCDGKGWKPSCEQL